MLWVMRLRKQMYQRYIPTYCRSALASTTLIDIRNCKIIEFLDFYTAGVGSPRSPRLASRCATVERRSPEVGAQFGRLGISYCNKMVPASLPHTRVSIDSLLARRYPLDRLSVIVLQ